ncbi:MAG: DUF4421 family protein [Flavobacteriia bacterium]
MVEDLEERRSALKQQRNILSYFILKASIIKQLIFFVYLSFSSYGQNDSLPYTLYKDNIVLYSDIGYSSAPFTINYDFTSDIDKIKYKNNFRTIIGLGICYKWLAIRLGIPLPGYFKPVSRFGKTIPINLGIDFTIKKIFCDLDFRYYQGYAIKDALRWNNSLNDLKPNEILSQQKSISVSANAWYFNNKDFKISVVGGKTGHYDKEVKTWYLKNTVNGFGVGNDKTTLIPQELTDSLNSKTSSSFYSAFDIGIVPGYAYVNKINNWQFSILAGLGGVLQSKFYEVNDNVRTAIGLAPRYDIRIVGGYTVPKYFVFLVTDFDNKSIRYNELVMRQSFYNIKIVGGIRFVDEKKKNHKNNKM